MISVDQLESPLPGFVPIAKGTPTLQRYQHATVFVNHSSNFTYMRLHEGLTGQETINAKHACKQIAEQHGVCILHYHCDNGRFADKAFMDDICQAHQTIAFCGIVAHQQNGIAECCICDIMESSCTSLQHAAHQWPKTIVANLWPQALKHATNIYNALLQAGKPSSPLSLFSKTQVQPNLKHFHLFGCPVYVLQAPLQNQNPFPKWGECSCISIFLCHSPHHAASVPLILSTQTGLVSPQFHCVFDNDFDTVKKEQHNTSVWQRKVHLQATQDKL